jgi:multicomponent Na+:H+ antiporter subunit D
MKSQIVPLSLGLLLVGFAFKTAIVPWHAWKPDIITATPAPIGAIFTAATTSVGIYIIFRLLFTVFYTPVVVFSFLILAGLATMVLGALLALQQENILRLLAYSVISQTGYVMLAFGVGFFNKIGYVAAVFHLLNMAVFDALLFFVAGVIIWQSGTARMTKFAGIQSRILSSAFVVGALASIGIPFLNGFASKWLIYVVTLHTWPLLMVAAALVTILTATYFLKAYFLIFLSNPKTKSKKIPLSMSFPIFVLALLCVIFGLFPELGINLAELVIQSFDNTLYISAV